MFNYQSILVTGGAGFIGANFIKHALSLNSEIQIINFDALTYAGNLDNLSEAKTNKRYHFVKGNIADKDLVSEIIKRFNIEAVVHFAAESHVDRSILGPAAFIETNIIGTFNLLEVMRQFPQCRFHHISTDEVYGSLGNQDPAFTEQHAYSPRSPYSASKAASDHLVNAYWHTYQLPITISNCSNNYGPYQHLEKFIPQIITRCLSDQSIPIYGNGKNIRDWLHVKDHCLAILRILSHGKLGETYNIGGDNEWENLKLAKFICAQMDELHPRAHSYTRLINFVTDRAGHDHRYAINNTKIKQELNWHPSISFAEGIKETILHFHTNNSTIETNDGRSQR